MTEVFKRSWQRINGSTLYTGLYFPEFGKFGLLVTNLSHGLRAIRIKGSAEFNFIGEKEQLDGGSLDIAELYEEAIKALEVDERFQRQTKLFEKLVKGE